MDAPVTKLKIVDFKQSSNDAKDPQWIFARSKAYRKLYDELYDYTTEKISGGSILISGHRGSGKTTLVQNAIKEVSLTLSEGQYKCKPLLVPLHGPDLLDINRSVETLRKPYPAFVKDANNQAGAKDAQLTKQNKLIKNVLEHVTVSLYRSLANEIFETFQQKVKNDPRSFELIELIGLLRLELDESSDIATIRDIWSKAGFLETGVLFKDRTSDQGIQEIVLLSSAAQAFRIVTGSMNTKETSSREAELETTHASQFSIISKDIINSLFGLMSGIAVGAGVYQSIDNEFSLLLSSITGIFTALFTSFTFTLTSKGTVRKKRSKEYQFIRNTDIASLNRELPNLINRIRKVGLAPIFIVDELDKIITPPFADLGDLIGYLKKLVSENSFFCFLTDRNYYDFISRIYRVNKYPKEYTYFTHRFYINYSPQDLHVYLNELFQVPPNSDQELTNSAVLMRYLLLNRSNLHTIDLKREIAKRSDDGHLNLEGIRSKLSFRFPIVIQLAIEVILKERDLSDRVDQDSYFSQLMNDALYYPVRSWLGGEKTLNVTKKHFVKYILERSELDLDMAEVYTLVEEENWTELERQMPFPMNDLDFLFDKVNELLKLLINTDSLRAKIEKDQMPLSSTARYQDQKSGSMVLDIIPRQNENSSINLRLLQPKSDTYFDWQFDYYGRSLEQRRIKKGVTEKSKFLTNLNSALFSLTSDEIGLYDLGNFQIINATPDWYDLEQSINRLPQFLDDDEEYPDLNADLESLDEYYAMIIPKGTLIGKTVTLAFFLRNRSEKVRWKDCFEAIGFLLNLRSEKGVDQLDKLVLALNPSVQNWDEFLQENGGWGKWIKNLPEVIKTKFAFEITEEKAHKEWWDSWEKRFLVNINEGKNEFDATINDLICASTNYSFAWNWRGDISQISKWSWSDLLYDTLKNNPSFSNQEESSHKELSLLNTGGHLPWPAVLSLIKLGFTFRDYLGVVFQGTEWMDAYMKIHQTNTVRSYDFFIVISQASIIYNQYILNQMSKPVLPIRYTEWEQKRHVIYNIVNFIKNPESRITLIVDVLPEQGDQITKSLAEAFGITVENTYRFTDPYSKEVPSEFKVIRRLDNL